MKTKKIAPIIVAVVISVLFCIRIYYVNTQKYNTLSQETYYMGDTFTYRNFEICVSDYTFYSQQELQKNLASDTLEFADEREIVIEMHVKNQGSEVERFDVSTFVMEYDYLSGGGINPTLFGYFNPNIVDLSIEANEEISILLPYPLLYDNLSLVLSLYPQKMIIEITGSDA